MLRLAVLIASPIVLVDFGGRPVSGHASHKVLASSCDAISLGQDLWAIHAVRPMCKTSQWGSEHAGLELRRCTCSLRNPRAKQSIALKRILESQRMHVIAKQSIVLKHILESDRRELVSSQAHHFTIPKAQTVIRAKKKLARRTDPRINCKCPQPDARPAQLYPAGASNSTLPPALLSKHVAPSLLY